MVILSISPRWSQLTGLTVILHLCGDCQWNVCILGCSSSDNSQTRVIFGHLVITVKTGTLPAIFILRLASSRRFSAFRSRCTIWRLWQYDTAAIICLNFFLASFSFIRPWATKWSVITKSTLRTVHLCLFLIENCASLFISYWERCISVYFLFFLHTKWL